MLTRLEAHGFKNLLDFELDFGPFTCIAGPNATGKSNVFDAIRFLSLLVDHTILDAALRVRGDDPDTADPLELFWTDGESRIDAFTLAAEMIVDGDVVDDFGRRAKATSTYLRYEVEIGADTDTDMVVPRLLLRSERLDYITQRESAARLHMPHSKARFRDNVVRNGRRSASGYISTERGSDGARGMAATRRDRNSAGRGQSEWHE